MRARLPDESAARSCADAANAAFAYQSTVTRDLGQHAGLHADTRALVAQLRSVSLTSCPETRRFLVAAEQTVASLCADCAVELRRVRMRA